MPSNATNRRLRLLLVTVMFEGALAVIALYWIWFRSLPLSSEVSIFTALCGLGMAVPLLLLNGGLYYFSIKKNPASRYAEFFFEVVAPICKNQTFVSAICIGIISGASEELFFRGALQAELQEHVAFPLAAVLTNILFSCGHFIGAMRRFARLILFYFLFGLYFSFLAEFLGSIWVPAIAHAVYNTIVIIGVGRLLRSS